MNREPQAPTVDRLVNRKLERGKDYWIEDQVLPNALEVAERCIAKSTWTPSATVTSTPQRRFSA